MEAYGSGQHRPLLSESRFDADGWISIVERSAQISVDGESIISKFEELRRQTPEV